MGLLFLLLLLLLLFLLSFCCCCCCCCCCLSGCSGMEPMPCFLYLWVRKKYLLQNSLQQISQKASVLMTPIWRSRSAENTPLFSDTPIGPEAAACSDADGDANADGARPKSDSDGVGIFKSERLHSPTPTPP